MVSMPQNVGRGVTLQPLTNAVDEAVTYILGQPDGLLLINVTRHARGLRRLTGRAIPGRRDAITDRGN